jgi:hypothetical protein
VRDPPRPLPQQKIDLGWICGPTKAPPLITHKFHFSSLHTGEIKHFIANRAIWQKKRVPSAGCSHNIGLASKEAPGVPSMILFSCVGRFD